MKDIKLKRKLFTTVKGTTAVYTAEYNGDKCYAIVNGETGFIAIFDYDDNRVWDSMRRFMSDKKYSISYDKDPAGLPRFKLATSVSGGNIDLRQFLWARYNKRRLSSLDGRVLLRQDDRADNFCDLRRHNLYMPAESIAERENIALRLVSNPNNENEKWIEVTFSGDESFTEYVQYTPELWEMLNTPRYVRLQVDRCGDRGGVEVDGYADGGKLARFICVYKKYFPLYQGKRKAIQRFIHDYKRLSEIEKDKHAAHVNSFYHENTFDNLMFMDDTTNRAMSDYIKWLADGYDAYTAVNERDEILLEFITPFGNTPIYYKFETPEDYADFQRLYIIGTKFTKKMQRVIYPTAEGLAYQMTPIGMRAAGIVNRDTVNARELDFWTDREHKNELLSLPEEAFKVYRKGTPGHTVTVELPEGMKKGDIVFFPSGGDMVRAEIVSVDLVRAGRKKTGTEDGAVTESKG